MEYISSLEGLEIAAGAEDLAVYESIEELVAERGWQVISGEVAGAGADSATIIEFTEVAEGLEGGVKAGTTAYSVVEGTGAAAGTYALETAGAATGVTIGAVVAGVFAGIGLGIVANDVNPRFWADLSNDIFGTEVPPARFSEYIVPGLYDNEANTLYVNERLIQKIYEYAVENGYENGELLVRSTLSETPVEGGYVTIGSTTGLDIKSAYTQLLYNLLHKTTPAYPVVPFNYSKVIDEFNAQISDFRANYGVTPNGFIASISAFEFYTRYDLTLYYVPLDTSLYVNYVVPNSDRFNVIGGGACAGRDKYYEFDNETGDIYAVGYWQGQPSVTLISAYTDNTNVTTICSFDTETYSTTEGVEPIVGANIYDPEKTLEQNFPAWVNGRKSVGVIVNPESTPTLGSETYLPLTIPEVDPYRYPYAYPTQDPYPNYVPDSPPQPTPTPTPYATPQDEAQRGKPIVPSEPFIPYYPYVNPDSPTTPTNPPANPTTKPTGNTPTIPIIPPIGGEANALFTVYNPTKAQLNSLGGVLWSSNIIQQIVQMFTNSPLDCIISLHILYATPSTGNSKNIKLGYIDTGISALEVTNQYINVPCGSVNVPEYFGDARDYSPFTTVHMYLPFVGIVQLKTEDVIRSVVTVDYKVDVYTGTVLATINIAKNDTSQVLYTFEGNCAVNLPLTGADKSRQLASAVTLIAGAATGGGAGALLGGSALAGGFKADIKTRGSFGSNAGAMGAKKPYIIINRSVPYEADEYNMYYGYPANKTVLLSSCSGFTRVKSIHVENVNNATRSEKEEIEALLKQGVIIH